MTASHCKDPGHLSVRVTPARATDTVTATYLAHMSCINTPPYSAWGVVLSKRASDPLYGMHLMPDGAAYLISRLRQVAPNATGAQTVTLRHTQNTTFITFACVTPAKALALATAIEAQVALAP